MGKLAYWGTYVDPTPATQGIKIYNKRHDPATLG